MYQKTTQYFQDDELINPWPGLIQSAIRIINEKPKPILTPGVRAAACDGTIERQLKANASLALHFSENTSVGNILDGEQVGLMTGRSCGELADMSLEPSLLGGLCPRRAPISY